ncbi:hypothetical protein, partial [Stenotrophomonas muris]|uniref:hypothetical protein n=1 Tax=Stenotrophomonas muris TaxID=2963283 RepID=UPI0039C6B006
RLPEREQGLKALTPENLQIFTRSHPGTGAPARPSRRKLPDFARRMAALCDRRCQRHVNHAPYFYDVRQITGADKMVLPKMHIAACGGESIPRHE